MQDQINIFDILVKTLSNEAKSIRKDSGLSHNLALDTLSKKYGFNHWHDITQLKSYVLFSFANDRQSIIKPSVNNLFIKNGFTQMKPQSRIHGFISEQHFARRFDFYVDPELVTDFFELETYVLRDTEKFKDQQGLKKFILNNLDNTEYRVIYNGHLYDHETLFGYDEDDVPEYAYFKEDSL